MGWEIIQAASSTTRNAYVNEDQYFLLLYSIEIRGRIRETMCVLRTTKYVLVGSYPPPSPRDSILRSIAALHQVRCNSATGPADLAKIGLFDNGSCPS